MIRSRKVSFAFILGLFLFVCNEANPRSKILESRKLHRLKRQAEDTLPSNGAPEKLPSSTDKIVKGVQPDAPLPPTLIRLRSSTDEKKANKGRIEFFDYSKKSWGTICDDYFPQTSADVACRQLGFKKGAQSRHIRSYFGGDQLSFNWRSVICNGDEKRIQYCTKSMQSGCSTTSGVTCYYEQGCPRSWFAFNGACYKIFIDKVDFRSAQSNCQMKDSKLAYILHESENSFISQLLIQEYPDVSAVWSGGWYSNSPGGGKWKWYDTIHNTDLWNITIWFPGFGGEKSGKRPNEPMQKSCIALKKLYFDPRKGDKTEAVDMDYFWWDNLSCRQTLPYVCQMTLSRGNKDCYNGNGIDYRGQISRTTQGSLCSKWTAPGTIVNPLTNPYSGLGDHNYCRNPDGDVSPWCWVDPARAIFGYCAVNSCSNSLQEATPAKILPGYGAGPCKKEQFFCPSMMAYNPCIEKPLVCNSQKDCLEGEDEDTEICRASCEENEFFCESDTFCISNIYKCDGHRDCRDAADEKNCPPLDNIVNQFNITEGVVLSGQIITYYSQTLSECLRKCTGASRSGKKCRTVNFFRRTKDRYYTICELVEENKNQLPGDKLIGNPDGNLYEWIQDCTGQHKCLSSGDCISINKKCNGFKDCEDNSDESSCSQISSTPLTTRLIGGRGPWEGRVEVHFNGEWGLICDDKFDINDAQVICKMNGFTKALEAVQKASGRFGRGNGDFKIDELECNGDEINISKCKSNPWGSHDCKADEVAGVMCFTDRACLLDEFRCVSDGLCISKRKLNDNVKDCEDGSDEVIEAVSMKLINQVNNGGLVIAKRGNREGTICDDDFDDNDAAVICRMLNIPGKALAVTDGRFGRASGAIVLDDLQCIGTESKIEDCPFYQWDKSNCAHTEDVGVICGYIPPPTTLPPPEIITTPAKMQCGSRMFSQTRGRVVNGYEAIYGAFPWQIGIRLVDPYDSTQTRHHCGGTLINDQWIVSAAHCFTYSKDRYRVRTGDWNNKIKDTFEEEWEVEELINHPRFDTSTYEYDLTLIRIKPKAGKVVEFNDHVRPACLPSADGPMPGPRTLCQASGWGSNGRYYPDKLQAADLPLIDPDTCNIGYKGSVNDRMMQCAGFMAGGIDTCQGDSGGPLVCEINGKFVIWGATSWGIDCARPNNPGVYAKVTFFLNWIRRYIPDV